MDRIGRWLQQARNRTGVFIFLGYLSVVLLDPFITIIRLNVENWAAAKKLDRLLVDGSPQGPVLLSLLADLLAGILNAIAAPISLAASPMGLAFALGALLVVAAPPLQRLPRQLRAFYFSVAERWRSGRVPLHITRSPKRYWISVGGETQKADYAVGDIVAFEPALACRIVENADAEYRWFWDRLLHRRYVWRTRGRHDVRICGTDLAYAAEQPESEPPSTIRGDEGATFYSDDPAGSAVDKQAYNDLLAFVLDYLLPACDAQMALQEAMIRELCMADMVANFAVHGWRDAPSYETLGFWKNYGKYALDIEVGHGG